jgi:uncharacterized protein YjbJ (UPF0337 family)
MAHLPGIGTRNVHLSSSQQLLRLRILRSEVFQMKALAWMAFGVSLGVAFYIIMNQPAPMSATGDPDVEDAADRTSLWGSKQRVSGAGNRLKGRIKEGLGRAIGDDELVGEGAGHQVVGAVKDAAGKVAQAAGQTLHDLNQ